MKPVSEPVRFTLPDGSLSEKAHAVLDAVAAGRLPADIGTQLVQALAKTAHIVEIDELERRIADLEARHEHEPTY